MGAREYRLPDDPEALAAVEAGLRQDAALRRVEYHRARAVHKRPPTQLPEHYELQVALRRWQFAYEKLLCLRRKSQPTTKSPRA